MVDDYNLVDPLAEILIKLAQCDSVCGGVGGGGGVVIQNVNKMKSN